MLFVSQEARHRCLQLLQEVAEGKIEALPAVEQIVAMYPECLPAYLLAGDKYASSGDLGGAEHWYWRAAVACPLHYAPFLGLADLAGKTQATDEYRTTLLAIALRKIAASGEMPAAISETLKALDIGDDSADYSDPMALDVIAKSLEESVTAETLPPDVAQRLLPFQLLTECQTFTLDGLDCELIDEITQNSSACTPVWRSAVREWANSPTAPDSETAALLLGMLGEIGGPEVLPDLLELSRLEDRVIFMHAHWAIHRIGKRLPAETLRVFRETIPSADLTLRCGIAEQLALIDEGFASEIVPLLISLLDDFASSGKDPDAPYLLLAITDSLSQLGEERRAEKIFTSHRRVLPSSGRKDLEKILSSDDGFVPMLVREGLDELTVEDVCAGRVLLDEALEDEDADEYEEEESLGRLALIESKSEPSSAGVPPTSPRSKPGRNEDCWCGSGKKYKKCHLGADEALPSALDSDTDRKPSSAPIFDATVEARLIERTFELGKKAHSRSEALKAARLYFGGELTEGDHEPSATGFFEWYIHDFRPPSTKRSLIEEHLRNLSLTTEERQILEAHRDSTYGLFEIQKVELDRGVILKDWFTSQEYFVEDVSTSRNTVLWDCILARVIGMNGRYCFGATSLSIPRRMIPEFTAYIRKQSAAAGQSVSDFMRANSHRFHSVVQELHDEWLGGLSVQNAEGDTLCFSTATYEVREEEPVLAALRSQPELQDETDKPGEHTFGWLEVTKGDARRSYGHVSVSKGRLRLECNSRERLERGRKLVEDAAGGFLRHLGDSFESLEALKRKAAAGPAPREPSDEIPEAVRTELVQKLKQEHYRKWPDEALPALGGKTPREAMKTSAGRKKVEALLRLLENGEQHARQKGEVAFDFRSCALP